MLEWTGERYVPWVDDAIISYEHLHRYRFAKEFVKDKKVLDLACGEGYGSFILAEDAMKVVGIDIDNTTIRHASSKYNRENLNFLRGSITDVPIKKDKIFDVIVCFEALEHIEEHEGLMREVRRLIKNEGIFIVSTPNKYLYSDVANFKNPFHLKELYLDDFKSLLSKFFKNIFLCGQKVYPCSNIFPLYNDSMYSKNIIIEKGDNGFFFAQSKKRGAKYIVAVASDRSIEKRLMQEESYLLDLSETLFKQKEAQIRHITSALINENKKKYIIPKAMQEISERAKKGQIAEAIEVVKQTLQNFPEQAKLLYQYALLLLYQGKAEEARFIFQQTLLYDHSLVQNIKTFEQYFDKEKGSFRTTKVIKENREEIGRDENQINYLGFVEKRDYEKAIFALKDLLTKEPDNPSYNNDLGVLYYKKGEKEIACQYLKKAVELQPENTDFLKNLGDLCLDMGQLQEAQEIGEKILAANPDDIETRLKIGYCLQQISQPSKALFHFRKVLEIDPENELAKEYLNKCLNSLQEEENPKNNEQTLTYKKDDSERPKVSIIIPVFNNLPLTQKCLNSIFQNTHDQNYEIIVVDNASTDGTKEFLKELKRPNIKVVFQNNNTGFGEACHAGAEVASGKYLLFLNNDTEVQPRWLESLVQFAESMPDCGAVGTKLIYPDGRLQEAGGIIFSDGNGWNYGRGMSSSDPRFNFVREVDYCSGAALMVRKDLWKEIGGFDHRYAPAYYEDTDLCFEIRKRGFKVYYHPQSVVIHHEGKTAGVHLQSGYKKYQIVNRQKFVEKWAEELKKQFSNDPRNVIKASHRGIKKNILVIDPFLPFFDRASGSLRLFHLLKILKQLEYHVTFIPRDGSMEDRYRPILENMGIEVYAGDVEAMKAVGYRMNHKPPVNYGLLFKERQFDYAIINFWYLAEYYLPLIRRYSPSTKIIVDTVDIHFVREIREAELKENPELKRKALANKSREIAIYQKADRLWVVSENDKKAIESIVGKIPIDIIPNIHEKVDFVKRFEETEDLLFVGNFNHLPNRDAAQYFCKEIFPLILKNLPDVKLYIVGNNPPEEVKAFASDIVIVAGYVEDLTPFLKKARISVNPLRYGAGMKGKIGEALSWGLPVVTTSIGAEGMGLIDGQEALIADSKEEFANKVVELYRDRDLWNKLSLNGKRKVETNWAPEIIKKRIANILDEADSLIKAEDLVSIIILTYNQLEYTQKCLESLFKHTNVPFELIMVDNASTDETPKYLRELTEGRRSIGGWKIRAGEEGEILEKKFEKKSHKKRRKVKKDLMCKRFKVIYNESNLGFAAGNNQGISAAKGNYLLIMNNDLVVTPGWLGRLLSVAEKKPEIGIVGPMSNYVSGPQLVKNVNYHPQTLNGLEDFALSFARKNARQVRPFWRVVGFCMLVKRAVIEKIGGFDERYGLGNFEDDDFSLRASLVGFESWIAEDCFVHHFGNRTFIGAKIDYEESLKRNWEIFKKKWGIPLDLEYGAHYDLGKILQQGFSLKKHFCPLKKRELTLVEGEELFQIGDIEGAKEVFERIIDKEPNNVDALNNLGVIFFKEGKIDQAISYFGKVLKINPHHAEALENMGNCFQAKGLFSKALECFEKALTLTPDNVHLLNSVGNCLIQMEDFSKAKEIYSQSYHLDEMQPSIKEILTYLNQIEIQQPERNAFA